MPLPAFVEATLQATIMSVISNVVAQYIESLKREDVRSTTPFSRLTCLFQDNH